MYSMSAEERHRKEVLSGKKLKDSKTGRAQPSKYKERGVVTEHMLGRIERYYKRLKEQKENYGKTTLDN